MREFDGMFWLLLLLEGVATARLSSASGLGTEHDRVSVFHVGLPVSLLDFVHIYLIENGYDGPRESDLPDELS